jgi:hypothetical protein
MAKNESKKGRSARNGNKPSPYSKYKKRPYPYGTGYKDNRIVNGLCCRNTGGKFVPLFKIHAKEDAIRNSYREAAE